MAFYQAHNWILPQEKTEAISSDLHRNNEAAWFN